MQGGRAVLVQSITEEWRDLKKRNRTARLINIDGYQVLKENNYSIEQVPPLDHNFNPPKSPLALFYLPYQSPNTTLAPLAAGGKWRTA